MIKKIQTKYYKGIVDLQKSIKFSRNWGGKSPQNAKRYLEWDFFFFDDWDTGLGQLVASPSLVLGSSSEKDFPQSLCA